MKNFKTAVYESDYLYYLINHYKKPHGNGDIVQACNGVSFSRENFEHMGCTSEIINTLDVNYFKDITKPQWHNKCTGWVSFAENGHYLEKMTIPRCVACTEMFSNLYFEINQIFNKYKKFPTLSWDGISCKIERFTEPVIEKKTYNNDAYEYGYDSIQNEIMKYKAAVKKNKHRLALDEDF